MITPAAPPWWSGARRRALLRALLSAHVLNGASVAVGIGVNLVSHVLVRHLTQAERRFDAEHRDD